MARIYHDHDAVETSPAKLRESFCRKREKQTFNESPKYDDLYDVPNRRTTHPALWWTGWEGNRGRGNLTKLRKILKVTEAKYCKEKIHKKICRCLDDSREITKKS